jgi:predicted amidohydrolase
LKARALENQCYAVGVNRIGYDTNNTLFNGNSKVFDPQGDELYSTLESVQETLQVELCLDELKFNRKQMNFLVDRDNFIIQ